MKNVKWRQAAQTRGSPGERWNLSCKHLKPAAKRLAFLVSLGIFSTIAFAQRDYAASILVRARIVRSDIVTPTIRSHAGIELASF